MYGSGQLIAGSRSYNNEPEVIGWAVLDEDRNVICKFKGADRRAEAVEYARGNDKAAYVRRVVTASNHNTDDRRLVEVGEYIPLPNGFRYVMAVEFGNSCAFVA